MASKSQRSSSDVVDARDGGRTAGGRGARARCCRAPSVGSEGSAEGESVARARRSTRWPPPIAGRRPAPWPSRTAATRRPDQSPADSAVRRSWPSVTQCTLVSRDGCGGRRGHLVRRHEAHEAAGCRAQADLDAIGPAGAVDMDIDALGAGLEVDVPGRGGVRRHLVDAQHLARRPRPRRRVRAAPRPVARVEPPSARRATRDRAPSARRGSARRHAAARRHRGRSGACLGRRRASARRRRAEPGAGERPTARESAPAGSRAAASDAPAAAGPSSPPGHAAARARSRRSRLGSSSPRRHATGCNAPRQETKRGAVTRAAPSARGDRGPASAAGASGALSSASRSSGERSSVAIPASVRR